MHEMGMFASEAICRQLGGLEAASNHGLELMDPILEERQSTKTVP
jgi:hypothetical protein